MIKGRPLQLMTDVEPASVPSFGGFGKHTLSLAMCSQLFLDLPVEPDLDEFVICAAVDVRHEFDALGNLSYWLPRMLQMLLLTPRLTTTTAKIMCTFAFSSATARRA